MRQDLRFAFRMLRSHAWFSAAIVVTLALGIGVNTTVFTLVNAVLFKPVPLPGGARLTVVSGQNLTQANSRFPLSHDDFRDFQKRNHSFEQLEASQNATVALSEDRNPPTEYRMARITPGLFRMIRTQPILGRSVSEADAAPGAPEVLLIGHRVWQMRYGGARDTIGRVVRITGKPATIIGVMPEGFRFPMGQDLWAPLHPTDSPEPRSTRRLSVFGLLKPDTGITEAGSDMAVIARQLSTAFPDTNKDVGVQVQTFHQAFNGGNIKLVFLLMLGAVGLVLLIACANVANMMLARALERRREISVRSALGASRGLLVRQLLVEAVLLSFLGGLLGLALTALGVHYFDRATAEVRPYWIMFDMDWVALGYFAALAIGSGLIFGTIPALRATRVDLNSDLKDGVRAAGNVRGAWIANALVVAQFALTAVLMPAAALMMKSFIHAQTVNDFVPSAQILTARLGLPSARGERYEKPDARAQFYEELLKKLSAMPGVRQAAIGSNLPSQGSGQRRVEIEGRPVDPAQAQRASVLVTLPGYFQTIGLELRAGRDFDQRDGATGREVAVVTREFAERHWPRESPLGKRFRFFLDADKPGPWIQVTGVSGNMVQNLIGNDNHPLVFLPYRQENWGGMAVILRTTGSPALLAKPLQATVQQLDADLPVFELMTLDEAVDRQRWFFRVFGSIFSLFAVIGLLISALGIYAVVAQAAIQRTREFGIRLALGATGAGIVKLVLLRGIWQLVLGTTIGLGAAFAVTRLLGEILSGVSPRDPAVFGSVAVLLAIVGVMASYLPARRASRLQPVQALRQE